MRTPHAPQAPTPGSPRPMRTRRRGSRRRGAEAQSRRAHLAGAGGAGRRALAGRKWQRWGAPELTAVLPRAGAARMMERAMAAAVAAGTRAIPHPTDAHHLVAAHSLAVLRAAPTAALARRWQQLAALAQRREQLADLACLLRRLGAAEAAREATSAGRRLVALASQHRLMAAVVVVVAAAAVAPPRLRRRGEASRAPCDAAQAREAARTGPRGCRCGRMTSASSAAMAAAAAAAAAVAAVAAVQQQQQSQCAWPQTGAASWQTQRWLRWRRRSSLSLLLSLWPVLLSAHHLTARSLGRPGAARV